VGSLVATEESNLGGELPNTAHETVSVPPSHFFIWILSIVGSFGTRGGTRTHTNITVQGILSPPRLPLRHPSIYFKEQYKDTNQFSHWQIFFCSRGGNWTHDLDCIRILLSPTELPDYVSPPWDYRWVVISVCFLSNNLQGIPNEKSQDYDGGDSHHPLLQRCPTNAVDILRNHS
jgi:hypothetical protein